MRLKAFHSGKGLMIRNHPSVDSSLQHQEVGKISSLE